MVVVWSLSFVSVLGFSVWRLCLCLLYVVLRSTFICIVSERLVSDLTRQTWPFSAIFWQQITFETQDPADVTDIGLAFHSRYTYSEVLHSITSVFAIHRHCWQLSCLWSRPHFHVKRHRVLHPFRMLYLSSVFTTFAQPATATAISYFCHITGDISGVWPPHCRHIGHLTWNFADSLTRSLCIMIQAPFYSSDLSYLYSSNFNTKLIFSFSQVWKSCYSEQVFLNWIFDTAHFEVGLIKYSFVPFHCETKHYIQSVSVSADVHAAISRRVQEIRAPNSKT